MYATFHAFFLYIYIYHRHGIFIPVYPVSAFSHQVQGIFLTDGIQHEGYDNVLKRIHPWLCLARFRVASPLHGILSNLFPTDDRPTIERETFVLRDLVKRIHAHPLPVPPSENG